MSLFEREWNGFIRVANSGQHRSFGYHLRLNLGGCDPVMIDDVTAIGHWLSALVKEIGMEAHGAPQVERFGAGDLYGVTGVQLITTSCITIHCDPPTAGAFIDVFSCRPFDPDIAMRFCAVFFGARFLSGDYVERTTPTSYEEIN